VTGTVAASGACFVPVHRHREDAELIRKNPLRGMTLRELGQEIGMKPHAVSKAIMRLAERLSKDARL
jgi:hypothetical protein